MLFRPWKSFVLFTLALSVVSVLCPTWLFFCSYLILCFHVMLLRNCLSDFEMVPIAPDNTGSADFLLWDFYILKFLWFFLYHISVSRNCNTRILTCMFLHYCHGLWCPVYYYHYYYYYYYYYYYITMTVLIEFNKSEQGSEHKIQDFIVIWKCNFVNPTVVST
jgi:hypothetical protein